MNFSELSKTHSEELQSLEQTLKDAEAALSVSVRYHICNDRIAVQELQSVTGCAVLTTGSDSGADRGEQGVN